MFVSKVPFLLDDRSQVWHFFLHSNGRSFKKWYQLNQWLMSDEIELKCAVICWCKNIWKNKAECCSTFTSGDILVYSKCGTELTKQMHCITIDDMETPSDAYGNILLRHRRLIILVSEWPRFDRYVSSEYLNTLNQVISSNSKILWMKPCATSIIFLLNYPMCYLLMN